MLSLLGIPRLHWMQPIENLKISLSYLLSPHTSSRYVFEGQTVKLKFSTVGWTVWCCGCRTPFIPSISRSKPHCSTMSRHFPIVFAVFPQFSIIFRIFPPGFHRFFPQFPWFPQPKRPTQMANGGHGTHVGVQVWSLGDHGLDGSRAVDGHLYGDVLDLALPVVLQQILGSNWKLPSGKLT